MTIYVMVYRVLVCIKEYPYINSSNNCTNISRIDCLQPLPLPTQGVTAHYNNIINKPLGNFSTIRLFIAIIGRYNGIEVQSTAAAVIINSHL